MATETETVGQRFVQLIAHLGVSKNAFAASLDKTATVVQHLVEERNKPGFDLLCKVFEVYPNVSKDWLLLGQGPMLLNGTSQANRPPVAPEPPVAAAPRPQPEARPTEPVAERPAPAPTAEPAPATVAAAPAAANTGWQTALYTQQMAHQLALAELRNQHLQEQQRLMQQMLDLLQRRP